MHVKRLAMIGRRLVLCAALWAAWMGNPGVAAQPEPGGSESAEPQPGEVSGGSAAPTGLPLPRFASLRSALESLGKVEDEALRRQLTEIAAHDVRRIDRLVTEIAEISRIDAQVNRTRFVGVNLLDLAALSAEQSREAWRLVEKRYAGGLATIAELLGAESSATGARLAHAAARYALIDALANHRRAIGEIQARGRLVDLQVVAGRDITSENSLIVSFMIQR